MLAKDRMVVILSERIAEDSCCYLRPSAFVIGPLPKVEAGMLACRQHEAARGDLPSVC